MKRSTGSGEADWPDRIPDKEWEIYQQAIKALESAGVPIALGGAFAVATYTDHWRNTKDLDVYILPEDRDRAVQAVTGAGFQDYYEVEEYDRTWIYRSYKGDVIVDLIWAMANANIDVDETWVKGGSIQQVRDKRLRAVPAEEMVWSKLYVLEKDRSDWPDVINIIAMDGDQMDWCHLVARLAGDLPLLTGVLAIFSWLDPGRAAELPAWLWGHLPLQEPPAPISMREIQRRAHSVDSRPWYAPLLNPEDVEKF